MRRLARFVPVVQDARAAPAAALSPRVPHSGGNHPLARPAPAPVAVEPPAPATDLADDVVADLATNLWRTRKKINPDGARDATQRAAARHLLTAWETLEEAGVEIQDHDGSLFRPGMALDVVAFEKTPGVRATMVLETVRPSVYRSGRCIQMGQVIVAQPEEGLGNGARNH
jgi:hypothetical protein